MNQDRYGRDVTVMTNGGLDYYTIIDSKGNRITISMPVYTDFNSVMEIINSMPPDSPVAPNMTEIITKKIKAAMEFGNKLILEYAVQNVMKGKTIVQITAISSRLAPLQGLLMSGSLYCAKQWMLEAEIDENISQQDIDYFVGKINEYLGIS